MKYQNYLLMDQPLPVYIKIMGLEKNTQYNLRIIGCYDDQPNLLDVIDDRIIIHGPFTTSCKSNLFLKDFRVTQQENGVLVQWDIDNTDSLNDFKYLLRWSNHSKACPANLTSNKPCCYQYVEATQYSVEISTESYSKYIMSIAIIREDTKLQELFQAFETSWRDATINDKEKQLAIANTLVDASSIYLTFNNMDCEKIKGPIFLNVQASASKSESIACCNSIPLKPSSKIQFPTRNNTLMIENLSSFCNYDVNIFMSRHDNYWDNKVIGNGFSASTAGTGETIIIA
ncbi:unnamed protein product [Ceutorhynchus assimilis]|uniref:Uncharacterized protein n=1 Tax=Ceutorhynchus assimilis TaxID=467358 RepID=A0A9N9MLK0_9CUCU|nr:unnamed protein product [Ceutorhynchus assimilis]